jgi:hypothetical protein
MTAIHPLRAQTQISAFKSVRLALRMQTVMIQLSARSVQVVSTQPVETEQMHCVLSAQLGPLTRTKMHQHPARHARRASPRQRGTMGHAMSAGTVSTRQRVQHHVLSAQLGSQTTIRSRTRRVSSAQRARMLRVDTVATASAVLVVASHRRLPEQAWMHVDSASRGSTVSQGLQRVRSALPVERTQMRMPPRPA